MNAGQANTAFSVLISSVRAANSTRAYDILEMRFISWNKKHKLHR